MLALAIYLFGCPVKYIMLAGFQISVNHEHLKTHLMHVSTGPHNLLTVPDIKYYCSYLMSLISLAFSLTERITVIPFNLNFTYIKLIMLYWLMNLHAS